MAPRPEAKSPRTRATRATRKPSKTTVAERRTGTKKKGSVTASRGAVAKQRVERRADAKLVARSMALLLRYERDAATAARAIGEHLLDEYFAGDVRLARSRSPSKPVSYGALADRMEKETSWDETDLRRAISMAIVYRSLDRDVRAKLGRDHLYRLASIEVIGERRKLAARIASGELSGEAVREAIAEVGASERSGGKPRVARAIRVARGLLRAVERARDDDALDLRAIRSLGSESRAEVTAQIRDTIRELRALLTRLEQQ